MCEVFQIFLDFKEVCIKNINEDFESKEVTLSLDFLGTKIENEEDDNIILIDGSYPIRHSFTLKSDVCPKNEEDFMFQAFGSPLKIQLVLRKLVEKSKRKSETVEIVFAEESLNLLHNLRDIQQKCKPNNRINLNVLNSQDTEISLAYEIKYENAAEVGSTLSLRIDDIHNFPLSQEDIFEATFQFPFDQKFRPVFMDKVTPASKYDDRSYLVDDLLKENNFEIDESASAMIIGYENFQTELGTNLFHDLIRNNRKMLIELKLNSKLYMTFVDLTILNHPGVDNVNFLVPLYEWSDKLISSQFQQEACFTINEAPSNKKRRSKKSINGSDNSILEEVLCPIINDEKYAALKINLTLSKALKCEQSLESLIYELNEKFPYKLEIKEEDFITQRSQKDFYCLIYQMSNVLERFMNNHLNLSDDDLLKNLKKFVNSSEFCLKDDLKEALTIIIGNTFNQDEKTETNHEFKLLMMKAFKELNQQMNSILMERYQKKLADPKVILDEKALKWQIEEYIGRGDFSKAENLVERQLTENLDEAQMREKAFYLLKLKKFDELEIMLRKLFRVSRYCSFSLYILSYIFVLKEEYEMAIFIFSILTKLRPQSMEYWILLSHFYEKMDNVPAVKFCSIKIQGTKFIPNYRLNDSVIHPEIIFIDPITNILWHQFKFSVPEYHAITRAYAHRNQNLEWSIERNYLDVIELTDLKKYQEGMEILKGLDMDDENEITLRILKGNILYEIKDTWKSICEYEIAFNLCLKFKLPFPLIPALRCGFWFLEEMENLIKAKKYFSYCCQRFGTFESFMGLGKTDLKLMIFHFAEQSFIEANLIDHNSSENWIYLALTSCKRKKFNIALNCYLTAKELNVKESQELVEVEKYLDI